MNVSIQNLEAHLLQRLRSVQQRLEIEPLAAEPGVPFADVLDSMGMVEFLMLLADDCRVQPATIEQCVERQFSTVAALAAAMHAAGLTPYSQAGASPVSDAPRKAAAPTSWLAASAVRLPDTLQPATAIDAALEKPAGWLESHAGIQGRRTWDGQDPLTAAAEAGRACLEQAGAALDDVGTLLVTSEAPPLLAGLAAALHHRLDLRPQAAAVEVGSACTGFLAALWLAQSMLPRTGAVLVIAVEAPTRWLPVEPGPAGEAAALFGDAAAACLVSESSAGPESVPLVEVVLGADGSAGRLLQVEWSAGRHVEVRLDGPALASRAVETMAQAVSDLARDQRLSISDLEEVVAHGGNGRLPALLARRLGLPAARVWSETSRTGNLGSATLPVAWNARGVAPRGPVIWTAVGAGLTWGAALTGAGLTPQTA